jgi:hypothetical protein
MCGVIEKIKESEKKRGKIIIPYIYIYIYIYIFNCVLNCVLSPCTHSMMVRRFGHKILAVFYPVHNRTPARSSSSTHGPFDWGLFVGIYLWVIPWPFWLRRVFLTISRAPPPNFFLLDSNNIIGDPPILLV